MRKSDALLVIEEYLNGLSVTTPNSIKAEEILRRLEEVGMLPPVVQLDFFDAIDNTWEKEDD